MHRSDKYVSHDDSRHRDEYKSRSGRDRRRSRSRSRDRDTNTTSRDGRDRRRSRSRDRDKHSHYHRHEDYGRSRRDDSRRFRSDSRSESKTSSTRTSSKNYSKVISGYDKMSEAEKLKARTRYQLKDSEKIDSLQSKSDREWITSKNIKNFDLEVSDFRDSIDMDAVNEISNSETFVSKPFTSNTTKSQDSTEIICKPVISHEEAIFGSKLPNVITTDAQQPSLQRNYALDNNFPSSSNKQSRWMEKLKSFHKKKSEGNEEK